MPEHHPRQRGPLKPRSTLFAVALTLLLSLALSACGGENPPAPVAQPTEISAAPVETPPSEAPPAPTASVVDAAEVAQPPTPQEVEPTPTQMTATSTGADLTALEALKDLQGPALAWEADARLGLLANTRPGREKDLLGGALGEGDIYEPTPGGKGRNWTLVAFSPSAKGAVAINVGGKQTDLIEAGAVTDEMIGRFTGPDSEALALSTDIFLKLVDSDEIAEKAGERAEGPNVGIALLSPSGLGLGPLPVPTGEESPSIVYELFGGEGEQQSFIFYDATTGAVVLDSASP